MLLRIMREREREREDKSNNERKNKIKWRKINVSFYFIPKNFNKATPINNLK